MIKKLILLTLSLAIAPLKAMEEEVVPVENNQALDFYQQAKQLTLYECRQLCKEKGYSWEVRFQSLLKAAQKRDGKTFIKIVNLISPKIAIFFAIKKRDTDLCRYLLKEFNFDIDGKIPIKDLTLLHYATAIGKNVEICKLLVEKGANINAITQKVCDEKNLKQSGFPCIRSCQQTPLHMAVYLRDLETCTFLVKNGAHINTVSHGISPLDEVMKSIKRYPQKSNLSEIAIALLLIKNGAKPTDFTYDLAKHTTKEICKSLITSTLFFPSKAEIKESGQKLLLILWGLTRAKPTLPKNIVKSILASDPVLKKMVGIILSSHVRSGKYVPVIFKECVKEELLRATMLLLEPILNQAINDCTSEIKRVLDPENARQLVAKTIDERLKKPHPIIENNFPIDERFKKPHQINDLPEEIINTTKKDYIPLLLCTIIALYITKKLLLDTDKSQTENSTNQYEAIETLDQQLRPIPTNQQLN